MNKGYTVISAITLPGAIMRALLQYIFCYVCKVEIKSGRCMRAGKYFGHIEHGETTKAKLFVICFLPSLIMLILGIFIAFPACAEIFSLGKITVISCTLLYGGISFIFNACPLFDDAYELFKKIYSSDSVAEKIFLSPIICPMLASSWLSFNCVKILLSAAFCVALPQIVGLFISSGV